VDLLEAALESCYARGRVPYVKRSEPLPVAQVVRRDETWNSGRRRGQEALRTGQPDRVQGLTFSGNQPYRGRAGTGRHQTAPRYD
jgi:hypothetical protein